MVVSGGWWQNVSYPCNKDVIPLGKMTAKAVLICRPNSHPFQERALSLEQPIKVGRSVARARASPNNAIFDCKVLSRNHALLWYDTGKWSYLDEILDRLSKAERDRHMDEFKERRRQRQDQDLRKNRQEETNRGSDGEKEGKKDIDETSEVVPYSKSPACLEISVMLGWSYQALQGCRLATDTKSSNGTFVNNQRLSKGAEESPPREVCSGDIVQFGVDVMENARKVVDEQSLDGLGGSMCGAGFQVKRGHFTLLDNATTYARNLGLKCFFENNQFGQDQGKMANPALKKFTPPSN
ncbi:unnamed protein product [Timema podura]|uniref:FHA domain-containing protein n=1 Tax=Timema podura TaxID=61482 RepID=A0ABN7NIY9_TIMPD|nr:unnamed protein product [Timema podura]